MDAVVGQDLVDEVEFPVPAEPEEKIVFLGDLESRVESPGGLERLLANQDRRADDEVGQQERQADVPAVP